ncbi:MAG: SPFH domain-containing protein [Acidimicrobiales bacterium]
MVALIVLLVIILLVVAGVTAANSIKVIPEYERAVFFRLGRVISHPRGPGIIVKLPVVHRLQRVTLRVEVVDIPPQSVITADNVTIQVDAVVYFQVMDPIKAVVAVDNFRFACQRIAMTSLRSIIGRYELDQLLAHRDNVNNELRAQIALSTHNWGVEVRQVEIKDIVLPPELISAMARQAEAERVRRAKVISASGEQESSASLARAAAKLAESPGALHLRTLHALTEIATENRSTIIVPIPIELLIGLKGIKEPPTGANKQEPDNPDAARSVGPLQVGPSAAAVAAVEATRSAEHSAIGSAPDLAQKPSG